MAATARAALSPSAHLVFDRAAPELSAHCGQAKARAEMRLKEIASLSPQSRTFGNTSVALDDALWGLLDETSSDQLLKYVAISSGVRAAASDCETLVRQFPVEVFAREDLYRAVTAYAAKKERLAGEDARLLEHQLRKFKRSGMALPVEQREQLKALRRQLVQLEGDFTKNLNEVDDFLLFSSAALAGLPDDYVARLTRKDDRYKITVDYPDYVPFMKNASDPAARRRLEALFASRAAAKNLPILAQVLALRSEAAQLLGYKNHASYVLKERMAKDPATVERFIAGLVVRLQPLARQDIAALTALKDSEEGAQSDHVIHYWDWLYYDNQRLKAAAVDKEKIKEYFPLETVIAGMFDVYQQLLGVKFRHVEDPALTAIWHPDVKLYEVSDAASGAAIGYFYMDLFPREGKYKHAAAFDLVDGRQLPDGSFQKPVAAIVANFPKPAPGQPSLLRHGVHEDVETLFHEFGHIMHQTLTKARHGRFSGASTLGDSAQDFVEAPSQMLENWVWDANILRSLSGRYDDPAQKIPADLVSRMIAAKTIDSGIHNLRQLMFARADMTYHAKSSVQDTTAVWAQTMRDVLLIPMTAGTHPEASFAHIMDGYDAGYYGYLWSEVYAADMFSLFQERGLLDPIMGRRYREEILEPGSSRDEAASLRRFLGREPNDRAFLRQLGLSSP